MYRRCADQLLLLRWVVLQLRGFLLDNRLRVYLLGVLRRAGDPRTVANPIFRMELQMVWRRWILPAAMCTLASIILVFQLGGFDDLGRGPNSGIRVPVGPPASVGDSVPPVELLFVASDSLRVPSSQQTVLLSDLANHRCALFLFVDPACPACLEVAPSWSDDAPGMRSVEDVPVFLVSLAGGDDSIGEFRTTAQIAFPALKTREPNQAASIGVLGVPTVWVVRSRTIRATYAGPVMAKPAQLDIDVCR